MSRATCGTSTRDPLAGSEIVPDTAADVGSSEGFLIRPPWSGKSLLKAFGFSFLLTIALAVAAAVLGVGSGTPVQTAVVGGLAVYVVLLLSIWLFVFRPFNIGLAEVGFTWPGIGTYVRIALLTLAVLVTEAVLMLYLTDLLGPAPTPSQQVLGTDRVQLSALEGVLLGTMVVVVGPFVEELIFRGLLLRYAAGRMPVVLAVIGTSVLFAVAHGYTSLIVVFFLLGVALSVVAIRTNGLSSPFLLHAMHNLVGLSVILAAS